MESVKAKLVEKKTKKKTVMSRHGKRFEPPKYEFYTIVTNYKNYRTPMYSNPYATTLNQLYGGRSQSESED